MKTKRSIVTRVKRKVGNSYTLSRARNIGYWLHSRTLQRVHKRLLRRFRAYAKWWTWQYRHHVHVFLAVFAVIVMAGLLTAYTRSAVASSIAPIIGSATAENTNGVIEFDSEYGSNVTVDNWTRKLNGFAWSADLGWVNFGQDENQYGPVTIGRDGALSGKAKVVNTGAYIDFGSGTGSNVTIANGAFSGYAWSDDLGWINFSSVESPEYSPDLEVTTNASDVKMFRGEGGSVISNNAWVNVRPYVMWSAGVDNEGGSGILGYCLYVGKDPTGNPVTTKGHLGNSSVSTNGACQYVVSGTSIDLSAEGVIGTALTSSNDPYYINIVAIDNSFNVYPANSPAQIRFKYDNTAPQNPEYITAPSQFVASKTVNLSWEITGPSAASDAHSGLAGLQYRIGANGTWYGDSHTGSQNSTDLLANDGVYTTQEEPDFASLVDGNNVVYFRTWDQAGNVSIAYVTATIRINTTSPSSPQNLSVSPPVNTVNSFAFSWLAPASFHGSAENITYCYTVNVLPTSSNCTFTEPGVTSLDAGAYATVHGDNTMYIVARDETGGINYATHTSVTFTANTPAPGYPLNLDIADVSIRATSNWKIALTWDVPSNVGAGISTYAIYRSNNGSNYTKVASTAGTSYVDSGISQQEYYYKISACDSANNCSALTQPVKLLPTGKFTSPANIISQPRVTTGARSATISWVTDRESDSKVQFGKASKVYQPTQSSKSDQVTSHSVTLTNLDPGTTYFYRTLWTDGDGNTGISSEYTFTTLPSPTIKDARATGVNLHNATVSFTSKGATSVKLYYGPGGNMTNVKELNTSTDESSYSVPLSGLLDGTTYTFSLGSYDIEGNEYKSTESHSFTTPPAPRITNIQFEPVPKTLTGTQKVTWTTNVPATSHVRYSTQGQPVESGREAINSDYTTEHSMIIAGLEYDTPYQVVITSQDNLGNLVSSDVQVFRTGLDTSPPTISDVVVQSSVRGTGIGASGQIVVSWKTDKPSTSQVAYGLGSSGDFPSKTVEDSALATNHTVVISNLPTSQVFHLKALSKDKAGNQGESISRTTIVGQVTDSALSIVFNALRGIFGI